MNITLNIKGQTNRATILTNVVSISIKEIADFSFTDFPLEKIEELHLDYQEYRFLCDSELLIVRGEDLKAIHITDYK